VLGFLTIVLIAQVDQPRSARLPLLRCCNNTFSLIVLSAPLRCDTSCSCADGEHLGSLAESSIDAISNPFAGAGTGPYGYAAQPQQAGDINPKQGLDAFLLDSLFERPSAELVRRVSSREGRPGTKAGSGLICLALQWLG
jgi:hypothetical protein